MGQVLLYIAIAGLSVFTHWQYAQGNIGLSAAIGCAGLLFGTMLAVILA